MDAREEEAPATASQAEDATPWLPQPPSPPPQPHAATSAPWEGASPAAAAAAPEDCIPAAWGPYGAAWAAAPPCPYATWPPAAPAWFPPGPHQQAYEAQQQWEWLAYQQQQQWLEYERQAALQQQQLQQPVFAISAPTAPVRAHPPAAAGALPAGGADGRLVTRKKKAAVAAEPSFGTSGALDACDSSSTLLPFASGVGDDAAADGGAAAAAWAQDTAPVDEGNGGSTASGEGGSVAAGAPGVHQPCAPPFKPYSLADYRAQGYDVKAARSYWALGGLGAPGAADPRLVEQQQKRERRQQFGVKASINNRARIAAHPPQPRAPPPRPGAECRERALGFARTGVPKPSSSFKSSASSSFKTGGGGGGTAAAAAAAEEEEEQGGGAAHGGLAHQLASLTVQEPAGGGAGSPEMPVGC